MKQGWIKLYRELLDGKLIRNPIELTIWIWCLLKANHKNTKASIITSKGTKIYVSLKPGQFITGRDKAGEELDMSPSTWHKYINKLATSEYYNCITIMPENYFTIITVNEWKDYQRK